MVTIVEIAEATTTLEALIDRALAGEEIVIARVGKPVVRLQPVDEPRTPRLGTGAGTIAFHEGWDDPMSEEELADCYGRD